MPESEAVSMGKRIQAGQLAAAVMERLTDYADVITEDMKTAVKNAGDMAKKEISSSAPKDSGAYARSWTVKKTKESTSALEVTVHSRNRYQIAHLLEHGHAKRGGGRVAARPHIASAEEKAAEQLELEIERSLRHG